MARNDLHRRGTLVLEVLLPEDTVDASNLASRSYGRGLTDACLRTLRFHDACLRSGLDDGRRMFKYVRHGTLVGVCGFHRYIWGPPDCAWLSWFFIDPRIRAGRHAFRMLSSLIQLAVDDGLERLYVETPSDGADYAEAGGYLERLGFVRQAILPGYYQPGVDMLVYALPIGRGATAAVP